ncbi:MAG: DUF1257 domain-containing protein [Planctomycetes bacterium]|nr:DUF1257 domain-containing protein [Planctomycetota bacterium]
MSHFTTIQTQVRDIAALRDACQELGLQVVEKADARGYAGNVLPGDYVVRLQGPYDIALNRQPDGTFGLTTDWWAGYVAKEVGPDYGKLLQLYGVHKAMREARKKGLTVRRQAISDGRIKLTIGGV